MTAIFFSAQFKDPGNSDILSQLNVINLFPTFFNEEEAKSLEQQVSLEEIKNALCQFSKDKSLGPDGWPCEFYLHFFDILGEELLQMVEYSRMEGYMSRTLNSTFLTLIPKVDRAKSFGDFRPIALCNLAYKLMTKIITNRLKPKLEDFLSRELFGFLGNRQILDDVGITQEVFHSIKTKKLEALILKMDLIKAYDRVDWVYLRLILLQIGIPYRMVNWIMVCVNSANFSVLVNGSPTYFFSSSRGIRQGCPLSPLLFILVIEGLRRLIASTKMDGKIKGIKVATSIYITHLLFVDDVILFGSGTIEEWRTFAEVINCFCSALGMLVSFQKSMFLNHGVNNITLEQISSFLPYQSSDLNNGVKYLGFFIKPNCYSVNDWIWLLQKVEKRINNWTYRCLSLGGRLVLLKAVLISIPVFWFSLASIPQSIISRIRKVCFNFLWSGCVEGGKYHLASWERIFKPYATSGWNIKHIFWFSTALTMKSMWRGLFGNSLWNDILHGKYIK